MAKTVAAAAINAVTVKLPEERAARVMVCSSRRSIQAPRYYRRNHKIRPYYYLVRRYNSSKRIRLDAKPTSHDAALALTSTLSIRLRTFGPFTCLPPSRHRTLERPKTAGTWQQDAEYAKEQRCKFSYSRTFPPSSTTRSPRGCCIIDIWTAWASSWSKHFSSSGTIIGNVTETAVSPTTETLPEINAAFNSRRLNNRPPNADRTIHQGTKHQPSDQQTDWDLCFYHRKFRRRSAEMHSTLYVSQFPKCIRRPQEVNAAVVAKKLLHVHDHNTNHNILVDFGAQISFVPPTTHDRRFGKQTTNFQSTNGSQIASFAERTITVQFGNKQLKRIFTIADVKYPLLAIFSALRTRTRPGKRPALWRFVVHSRLSKTSALLHQSQTFRWPAWRPTGVNGTHFQSWCSEPRGNPPHSDQGSNCLRTSLSLVTRKIDHCQDRVRNAFIRVFRNHSPFIEPIGIATPLCPKIRRQLAPLRWFLQAKHGWWPLSNPQSSGFQRWTCR